MPFNFRLNLQNVFRRLGIQTGARLPQLNDTVQMTMLVTDLSRLVPAPIEPRGLAGVNLSGSLGNFSTVQLQSLAAGGIFIEKIIFRAEGFNNNVTYMFENTLTDLGMPVLPGHINIGGTPVFSKFTGAEIAVATTGAPVPATSGNLSMVFEAGIFVPNQAFFSVTTSEKNNRLAIAIFYRELPSIEEVG